VWIIVADRAKSFLLKYLQLQQSKHTDGNASHTLKDIDIEMHMGWFDNGETQ